MPAPTPGTSSFQATFGNMTDNQLKQTISQLSTAASQTTYANFRSPIPQATGTKSTGLVDDFALMTFSISATVFEARQWSATPNPKPPRQRNRAARTNTSTPVQQQAIQPHVQLQVPAATPAPANRYNTSRSPLPTAPQALRTTYASRLRTGTTLLMQPILASSSSAIPGGRTGTRRGGVINYADPGSGDELDAGAIDTDDSDFVASGGTRTAIRSTRTGRPTVGATFHSYSLQSQQGTPAPQGKQELDQSYLGMIPPAKFISSKRAEPTKHDYQFVP